jgi:hypothetical protein
MSVASPVMLKGKIIFGSVYIEISDDSSDPDIFGKEP